MPNIEPGTRIRIRCKVSPGPFSDEPVVTLNTVDGPISGFIASEDLIQSHGNTFVRGVVQAVNGDVVKVWVRGSFFTTNGLAAMRRDEVMAA